MYPKKESKFFKKKLNRNLPLSSLVTKRVTHVMKKEDTRGEYKAKDIKSIVLA